MPDIQDHRFSPNKAKHTWNEKTTYEPRQSGDGNNAGGRLNREREVWTEDWFITPEIEDRWQEHKENQIDKGGGCDDICIVCTFFQQKAKTEKEKGE